MTNPIDNGPRVPGGYAKGSRPGASQGAERPDAGKHASTTDTTPRDGSASESTRLNAVREAIDNTPEVDSDRIQDLRSRISRGEYPLDADRIAERFADFERLLSDG